MSVRTRKISSDSESCHGHSGVLQVASSGALFLLAWGYFKDFSKGGKMITYLISGIFCCFAALFINDSVIETVIFNKRINTLQLERYDIYCQNKHTRIRMDYIQRVYAVRRGIKKPGTDTTHYALIVKTVNNQRIKILETRNALRIRKELLVVRKFLELEDEVLAIYDEIRTKPGSKKENRFANEPVLLETETGEDGGDEQEMIEIVADSPGPSP